MRAAYTGSMALTFNDYTDLGTGKTLHAEPGGVYDIIPASSRPVYPLPPRWFTPLPEQTAVAEEEVVPGEPAVVTEPAQDAG